MILSGHTSLVSPGGGGAAPKKLSRLDTAIPFSFARSAPTPTAVVVGVLLVQFMAVAAPIPRPPLRPDLHVFGSGEGFEVVGVDAPLPVACVVNVVPGWDPTVHRLIDEAVHALALPTFGDPWVVVARGAVPDPAATDLGAEGFCREGVQLGIPSHDGYQMAGPNGMPSSGKSPP